MFQNLIAAFGLMAICVCIHASGLALMISLWKKKRFLKIYTTPRRITLLLVKVAAWMIFLHLIQILAWAFFYYKLGGAFSSFSDSFYFSSVTYTTTGFGDVVLPEDRRLMGGIQALTGILMCGVSTGLFFAVFSRTLARINGGTDPADTAETHLKD